MQGNILYWFWHDTTGPGVYDRASLPHTDYARHVLMPVLCRFIECIKAWRQKLIDSNFQELVFDEEMGMLLDQVLYW